MKSRIEEARRRKAEGTHNCCQAVLTTYADLVGLDPDAAMAIASGFGAGMGCAQATCGAILGAGMAVSALLGDRASAMPACRLIYEDFARRNGATVCRQLKGLDTGIVLRRCPDCVADAAALLENEIAAHCGCTFDNTSESDT